MATKCEVCSVTMGLSPTVSQLYHAFAEPEGHRRTPEETEAGQFEYRRTRKDTPGHERTRHTAGSGP